MTDKGIRVSNSARTLVSVTILLIAFALRCFSLDAQELRGDEAFGYFFSQASSSEIVEKTVDLREPHPVASYWLQHGWLHVAGDGEFALRYSGVWWSLLAVALIVPLARRLLLNVRSTVVATSLMAISPYVIWHAQDARMYSMSLALTMASTWIALRWWDDKGGTRRMLWSVAYLPITWLALQTHYFALYIVLAQNIALLGWAIVGREWRKLIFWWVLGALTFLAWLPWLWIAWPTLVGYGGNGDSPGLINALVRAQSAFGSGEATAGVLHWWLALGAVVAIILGISALWRKNGLSRRASLFFLMVYWLFPLVATWFSALSRPIFNERYLVAIVPAVYLLMAAAVESPLREARWQLWLGRAALALVAAGMIVSYGQQLTDPTYSKSRGWRGLAAALARLTVGQEGDQVRLVENYPDPTLWYYYRGAVPHLVLPPRANDELNSAVEVAGMVADGVDTVLLIEQPDATWDASTIARKTLAGHYAEASSETVGRWPVSVWLRPAAELADKEIVYQGGLSVARALVTPTNVSPGSLVKFFLAWRGDFDSLRPNEAVSLQLLDRDGALVAQTDRPLVIASGDTGEVSSYAILLPEMLPAGEYRAVVVVYDPDQPGAPRRRTIVGEDAPQLATITVVAPPR